VTATGTGWGVRSRLGRAGVGLGLEPGQSVGRPAAAAVRAVRRTETAPSGRRGGELARPRAILRRWRACAGVGLVLAVFLLFFPVVFYFSRQSKRRPSLTPSARKRKHCTGRTLAGCPFGSTQNGSPAHACQSQGVVMASAFMCAWLLSRPGAKAALHAHALRFAHLKCLLCRLNRRQVDASSSDGPQGGLGRQQRGPGPLACVSVPCLLLTSSVPYLANGYRARGCCEAP
jgi:hypothetical protein